MKRRQVSMGLILVAIVFIVAFIFVFLNPLVAGIMTTIFPPAGGPHGTRPIDERNSASYWAGADIAITRYTISSTPGNSGLVIRNNRAFEVNLTEVTMAGSQVFRTSTPIVPGSSVLINLSNVPPCKAGETYQWIVVISYNDAVYGMNYNFTGEKPLVGACAP
jgi:hypothetical protein